MFDSNGKILAMPAELLKTIDEEEWSVVSSG